MSKYKIGDKFKVVGNSKNKYGEHCFEIGSIVELRAYHKKRDGSNKDSKKYGEFLGKSKNRHNLNLMQTVKFKDLEYQEKIDNGFKIGDKFKVISNKDNLHCFNIGDVVTLVDIDDSCQWLFELDETEQYIYLSEVKKIN